MIKGAVMRFSEIDIVEVKDPLGNTSYGVRGITGKTFVNKPVARAFIRLANEYEAHMLAKWDEVIVQIEAQILDKNDITRQ
jgi:hypothetical protein